MRPICFPLRRLFRFGGESRPRTPQMVELERATTTLNHPRPIQAIQRTDMTTQTKLIRREELRFKKVVTGDPGKDLRERTKSFALRIVRMFSALPKTTEAQILGKQVLRSGTSVGANYR